MQFKSGEKVKAFVQLGVQTQKQWTVVEYVEPASDETHCVRFHEQIRFVSNDEIRHFRPIDPDAVENFSKTRIAGLYKLLRDAIERVGIKELCGKVSLNEDEGVIYLMDDAFSIQAGVKESNSILGIIEQPCWKITTFRDIPAKRWEPADVVECDVGDAFSDNETVEIALVAILRTQISYYMESLMCDMPDCPDDIF